MLESEEDDRKSFEVIAVEKKNIFQAQKPTRWIALWGGELEKMP